jgi:hypothetical protein
MSAKGHWLKSLNLRIGPLDELAMSAKVGIKYKSAPENGLWTKLARSGLKAKRLTFPKLSFPTTFYDVINSLLQ